MAKIKSAKKAYRSSLKRRVFNARRARAMKDTVKEISKYINAKNARDALATIPKLFKTIDKAAKNGTIKKNTAARMKSRISKRIKAIPA